MADQSTQPEPTAEQVEQCGFVDAAFDQAANLVTRAGIPRAVALPGLGTTVARLAIAEWGPAEAAQWLRQLAAKVDELFGPQQADKPKWHEVDPNADQLAQAAQFGKRVCAEMTLAEHEGIPPGVMAMTFGEILELTIAEAFGPEAVAPWFRAKAEQVERSRGQNR